MPCTISCERTREVWEALRNPVYWIGESPFREVSLIKSIFGKAPRIAESAYISKVAVVIGDVEIGEESSVWPGAVVRGDEGPIRIGSEVHIQDNCVVHCGREGLEIGSKVNIGHGVVVHCHRIGSNVLIGNNATILDNVEIGDFCMVAAGAVVPPRTTVPAYSLVVGPPAEIKQEIYGHRLEYLKKAGSHYTWKAKEYKKAEI